MKTTQRIVKSLVASALALGLVASANTAAAGTGATEGTIATAIRSNGVAPIISALEQAEKLICGAACSDRVIALLSHDEFEVREVAAWWIAKRRGLMLKMTSQGLTELQTGDSITVRNAADMLGAFRARSSVSAMGAAYNRTGLDAEARLAIVRAIGNIGVKDGNATLEAAMADSSADVRLAALTAWTGVRHQTEANAAASLLSDSDSRVRRMAATLAGKYRQVDARVALEALLADSDPHVARNAAYALGRIGDKASYQALLDATTHDSGLVRRFATLALSQLR